MNATRVSSSAGDGGGIDGVRGLLSSVSSVCPGAGVSGMPPDIDRALTSCSPRVAAVFRDPIAPWSHLDRMQHSHWLAAVVLFGACGGNVSSDEDAKRAYVALDGAVGKSLGLGFDGFNSATSANISPQTAAGDSAGMLVVTGQVDQGSSSNKTMRLDLAMTGYDDGTIDVDSNTTEIVYDTGATEPALALDLKNIPTGTFSGTLTGDFTMSGDLTGDVTLDLTIDGTLAPGPNGTVIRAGTSVTGTAVSNGDTYDVDLML